MKAINSFVFLAVTILTSAIAKPVTVYPGPQLTTAITPGGAGTRRPAGPTSPHPSQAQYGSHDLLTRDKQDKYDDMHGNSKVASGDGSMSPGRVLASQHHPLKSSSKDDSHSGKNDHFNSKEEKEKNAKGEGGMENCRRCRSRCWC